MKGGDPNSSSATIKGGEASAEQPCLLLLLLPHGPGERVDMRVRVHLSMLTEDPFRGRISACNPPRGLPPPTISSTSLGWLRERAAHARVLPCLVSTIQTTTQQQTVHRHRPWPPPWPMDHFGQNFGPFWTKMAHGQRAATFEGHKSPFGFCGFCGFCFLPPPPRAFRPRPFFAPPIPALPPAVPVPPAIPSNDVPWNHCCTTYARIPR